MRLGYFTMPVHPMHRSWVETLKEDREAIILADKLGFYDAFVGERGAVGRHAAGCFAADVGVVRAAGREPQ